MARRKSCRTALICGCGGQAPAQLRALLRVRNPARIYAYDQDAEKACAFSARLGAETGRAITLVADLAQRDDTAVLVRGERREVTFERGDLLAALVETGVQVRHEHREVLRRHATQPGSGGLRAQLRDDQQPEHERHGRDRQLVAHPTHG